MLLWNSATQCKEFIQELHQKVQYELVYQRLLSGLLLTSMKECTIVIVFRGKSTAKKENMY